MGSVQDCGTKGGGAFLDEAQRSEEFAQIGKGRVWRGAKAAIKRNRPARLYLCLSRIHAIEVERLDPKPLNVRVTGPSELRSTRSTFQPGKRS